MIISGVHEIEGGDPLFKIFVFHDNGVKLGEFEFSEKSAADDFYSFLNEKFCSAYQEYQLRKALDQN